MFSDHLSENILRILDIKKWTYEIAAEFCDISPRNMGNIVWKKVQPKLFTIEKLCKGLHVTPNELLLSEQRPGKFTMARAVRGARAYYPVCPGCTIPCERGFWQPCESCKHKPQADSVIILIPVEE